MIRYVAFLRGINLGNRRLKMDALRRHFEALDAVEDPSTYLASGNVIFDVSAPSREEAGPEEPKELEAQGRLEEGIEAHLRGTLGYEVDTFVRRLAALDPLLDRVRDDAEEAREAGWVHGAGAGAGGDGGSREGARDGARKGAGEGPGEGAGEGVEPVKPQVIFLRDELPAEEEGELRALETPDDRFRVLGREVVWMRRGRLSDSSIEPRHLAKALGGRTHTMRTLNTVRRIVKKFGA